jgi:malonyl-CoA O-methyltransferase
MNAADRDEYFLDPRLVRRAFDRISSRFDAHAYVHGEIRNRLLERLDLVRLQPNLVLDLGAGTGHAARALQDRYRHAYVVAMDISPGMLVQARRQQRLLKRFGRIAGDAQALSLKANCVDLVFSNLMLQWCSDLDRVFSELARVVKPGGLVTFASLGPDTLRELRANWADSGSAVHVHRFIDMHDVGDALLRAGFAEPVMDTERLTVTYQDIDRLLTELRCTGSTNRASGRSRGLRPPRIHNAARARFEALKSGSSFPISLEIVYGHAWATESKGSKRTDSKTFAVPLSDIRRR